MLKSSRLEFVSGLGLSLLLASAVLGQSNIGVITGSVTDSTGAVIPGASVTIRDTERGVERKVQTQANGVYISPDMQPGQYTITVESDGFQTSVVSRLRLDVGGRLIQDFEMQVGQVAETITVEGVTSLVDTTRGSVGDVIENKRILELPLNGRQVFDLVTLTPGSFRMNQSQRGDTDRDIADVSIAGGRTRSAGVYIDGVINSRTGLGASIPELSTPIDAISEVRVDANASGAEMGRSSAGFVNATTKGGTNEFHGALYEFLRNDALDARGWDADQKTKLRRNNFGGNLGGPIAKNRTFFFYNFDQMIERRDNLRTRSVPLDPWRNGSFLGVQRSTAGGGIDVPIYDPLTGPSNVRGGTDPFPNNTIPTTRIDPVAARALSFVPGANRQPNDLITQAGNWQRNVAAIKDRTNHLVRMDHDLGPNNKLMGRYTIFSPATTGDRVAAVDYGPADPDFTNAPLKQQNALLQYTKLLSPTFFMTGRAGFFRFFQHTRGNGFGEDWPSQLGLAGVPQDVFPRFNIGGDPGISNFGSGGPHNRRFAFTNFEYAVHLTKVAGNHAWKWGVDYKKYQGSEEGRQQASGVFTFNGQDTRGLTPAGAPIPNTGLRMADFLLGEADNVQVTASPSIGRRASYMALFIQDDWRITNRLTLNLGLRYDYETPFHEVADRMANWDPGRPLPAAGTGDIPVGQLGAMVFAGRQVGSRTIRPDRNNVGPRFGFAYRPFNHSRTVVRGGFGVLYGANYDGNVLQTGSQGFVRFGSLGNGIAPPLRDGMPADLLQIPSEENLTSDFGIRGSRFPLSRVDFVDQNHRTPYAFDYNVGVQHQIGEQLVEVRYMAKLAKKVNLREMNINQIHPDNLGRTDVPAHLLRPFPQYAGNAEVRMNNPNFFRSDYHAVSLKLEKRFNAGLGYIFTYTWSRWHDNAPFVGEGESSLGDHDWFQNIYDYESEWSLSNNHTPHRVVISPIYELPFGKGQKFLGNSSGVADKIIGGWQVSTIGILQSGAPFGPTVLNGPRDFKGDQSPAAVLRPNIVGDPNAVERGAPAVGRRGIQWFNPDAFAAPARFTLGDAPRNLYGILGPPQYSWAIVVAKNTRINERYNLQFRWEMFNAFNNPEFSNPIDQVFQSGMGTTTGGNSHREMQAGLKLYF